ncbi:MAG: hypothetical protein BMS9Abin26_2007 [Gammaproteobacteria bacterium]|nr:MAG: hypothetical protein BMS9Abin26_2007 [Gammaproteobacteria bacterium]
METITGQIDLLSPYWLWGLPVLLVIFLLIRHYGQYDDQTGLSGSEAFYHLRFMHPLASRISNKDKSANTGIYSDILYLIIFSLLTLSLAEPVRIGEKMPPPADERDITFIVDTSVSMVLRDYIYDGERIDRMSLLKGLLDRFVQQLHGERISIIVFGDAAYTLVPLTSDTDLIRKMIARIETTIAGRSSAVGDAIALGVKTFVGQTANPDERRQILVLLTDANQPSGVIPAKSAARLAKQAGLPLYTIAIGAGSYAAEEQRVSGLIYHPADLELLKTLATTTSAKNYQAGDVTTLEQAIADIERREKNKAQKGPQFYHQPLYLWPIFMAMLILTLNQFMRLYRH